MNHLCMLSCFFSTTLCENNNNNNKEKKKNCRLLNSTKMTYCCFIKEKHSNHKT